MSPHDVVSGALQELREYAARQQDSEKLRELVIEINGVLDVIEVQLAKLEGGKTAVQ